MKRVGLCLLTLMSGVQAVPVSRFPSGQIINWPASHVGEVRLGSSELTLPVAIDAGGRFTLNPPAPEQVEPALHRILDFFKSPTLAPSCTGKGAAVPTNTRYAVFSLHTADGREVHFQAPDGQARALLLYLTRPTTLRGTVTCANVVYHVSGTYHAGLVLVPLHRKEQNGKTEWHWDDMLNLTQFQWTLAKP